ncbi:MAG TPA: ThuA domain-containing protein [Humisphaera sp.]|nr:ThuA domain-containing protein [Humisphaera sp.]
MTIHSMFLRPAGRAMIAVLVAAGCTAVCRAADEKPVKALLVIGGGYHDYAKQKEILTKGLSAGGKIEVTLAYDASKAEQHPNDVYKNPDWAKGFDVVIHDECTAGVTDLKLINDTILKPHRDGIPGVVLHCGMHCYRTDGWNTKGKGTPWMEFTGLQTTGHGQQIPIVLNFEKDNPITKGLSDWTTIKEELYNNFAGKLYDTAKPLAHGKQTTKTRAGEDRTDDYIVAWTNMYQGKTRVFCTTLGHNNETVEDPRYLQLVSNGILWAAGRTDVKTASSGATH